MLASQRLVKLERILYGKNEVSSRSETAGSLSNLLRLRFGQTDYPNLLIQNRFTYHVFGRETECDIASGM